jgi:putative MFS transporter
MPESPYWLARVGRGEEARESVAWALQMDPGKIPLPSAGTETQERVRWRELFHYPRSLAVSWLGNLAAQTGIYGLSLWAPTLLVQLLKISPARAASLMIACSAGAFIGRLAFAYLSDAIGRRMSGGLFGFAAASLLILASYLRNEFIGMVSVFWLVLVAAYFFADGGFAIVGPYAAEVWPSRLRATGMGSAYGFGGIGKIIGPLGLALIVGSSNIVTPKASAAKIVPAFIYLGAWYAVAGIVYSCFGIETSHRSIAQIDRELETGDPG